VGETRQWRTEVIRFQWCMPNGAEGYGALVEDSELPIWQAHVAEMNGRYGAGTHWVVKDGQRLPDNAPTEHP